MKQVAEQKLSYEEAIAEIARLRAELLAVANVLSANGIVVAVKPAPDEWLITTKEKIS